MGGVALHIESRKGTALSALLRATGFGRMCVLRLWRALSYGSDLCGTRYARRPCPLLSRLLTQ